MAQQLYSLTHRTGRDGCIFKDKFQIDFCSSPFFFIEKKKDN